MKNLLVALIALSSVVAQAEVKLISGDQKDILISVTNAKDVKTLNQILENSSLREGAAGNDYSHFRSITCNQAACTLVVRGELRTSADAADYYTNELNKSLRSLKANEELLLVPGISAGNDGTINEFDGRLTRALMNANALEVDRVSAKLERNLKTQLRDRASILVMTASADLSELKIKCYTSLELEMGIQSFAQNSCALEAVVTK